jgi:hypothetical protein
MEAIPTIDPSVLRDAYHAILELGMENLQRFRLPERFEYLAIEIDHLHNIPHYMRETNVFVHAYYFCTTRPFYIERLAPIPIIETQNLIRYYAPHWQILRDGLLSYAAEINSHQYMEKL